MRAILQSIQFGMIAVGSDRKIRMVNKAALSMMGFTSEDEIVGSVCHKKICPAEVGRCPILDLGLKVDLSQKVLLHRDGRQIPILKTVSVMEIDGEKVLIETFVDITERVEAEREVEETRAFLQSVIDSVAEPVLVFGTDHRVSLMNRAAREFSLAQPDTLGELTCYQVSHHRDTPCSGDANHPCPMEEVKKAGKTVTVVHRHYTPSGEPRFVEIMASPLKGVRGGTDMIIETSRDITERINLERQKSDLLAMVTHDLKSPLSVILGYSDMILSDRRAALSADILDMVSGMQHGGRKILGMVEDFLTVSKLERGDLAPHKKTTDVFRLLSEAAEEMAYAAAPKGVGLKAEIPEGLPKAIIDESQVMRAVTNLLQNAVNYTRPGGSVTLGARTMHEGGREYIAVTVADTGIGISPEDLGHIFEKYYRSPKTAGIKGSGLGLAVVKAVAESHGGRVEVESEPGKGSTFTLILPTS